MFIPWIPNWSVANMVFHRSWLMPHETDEENMFLEHVLVYPCKNISERWVLSIIKSSISFWWWNRNLDDEKSSCLPNIAIFVGKQIPHFVYNEDIYMVRVEPPFWTPLIPRYPKTSMIVKPWWHPIGFVPGDLLVNKSLCCTATRFQCCKDP